MSSPWRRGAPVIQLVDDAESWRLLGLAPLGRVGLTDGALPTIMPVHFTVRDGEVVFASLPDVKIHSAERGDILVFQVDHYDPATEEGWSVNAVGPARVVRDPEEVDTLDDRGFTPWAGDRRMFYIAIRPGVLRGRHLTHAEVPAARTELVGGPAPATGADGTSSG